MHQILLAYCHENADLARSIEQNLGRIGIPFAHLHDRGSDLPGYFAQQLRQTDDGVVLLITDNFLKSQGCLSGLLSALQELVRRQTVQVVIADGKKIGPDGLTLETVETHIDRMVHALQYMNYWQTAWLDRSREHQHAGEPDRSRLGAVMQEVHDIANEMGDLIGLLREQGFITLEQFERNDYAVFFRQFELQDWHQRYRELSALYTDLPPIPPAAPRQPLAEIPVVDHLLAPAPALTPAENAPEPMVQTSAPPTEVSIEPPLEKRAESELEQTIRDAWFWLEKGHLERGFELFELAREQYPDHAELLEQYRLARNRFTGEALQPAAKAAPPTPTPAEEPPAAPPNEVQTYLQMGEEAAAKGDYLFTKFCWDRVAELSPNYPGIFRKLGLLTSEHLKEYKETAVHYLNQALQYDPNDAAVHFRLSQVLREQFGDFDGAIRHLNEAVRINPQSAQAWFELAQIHLQTGLPAQSSDYYRRAVELEPALRTEAHERIFLAPPPAVTPAPAVEQAPPPTAEPVAPVVEAPQPEAQAPRTEDVLTVLITGASSGIGRATAELFARHGHRLILVGRREERLRELKHQFENMYGAQVLPLAFDVRDYRTAQQMLESRPEEWLDVDVLINNAGLAKGLSPIHEGDLEHWETMIDTNIKGLLYVTRLVTPSMVRRRRGHIINLSSSAGKEVYPNGNVYCATKFAVEALTRSMRLDLHAYNIRVSEVSPGHVEETEFALTRFDGDAQRARIYDDFQPLKASDVAEVIYFIVSRPPHVNIQDVWMFGTQQASSTMINRSGR